MKQLINIWKECCLNVHINLSPMKVHYISIGEHVSTNKQSQLGNYSYQLHFLTFPFCFSPAAILPVPVLMVADKSS